MKSVKKLVGHKQYSRILHAVVIGLILLGLSVSVSRTYQQRIVIPNRESRAILHIQIVHNEAKNPFRYRVLYPRMTQVLIRLFPNPQFLDVGTLDPNLSVSSFSIEEYKLIQIWYLLDTFFIFLFFLGTYLFLERFSVGVRLLGCYLVYQTLNAILIGHSYQPWSLVEGGLITFAFYLASKITQPTEYKKLALYTLLVFLACINRETGIFVTAYFIIYSFVHKQLHLFRKYIIFLSLLTVFLFVGIRFFFGSAATEITLQEIYAVNFTGANYNLMKYEYWNMFFYMWIPIILGIVMFAKKYLEYIIFIMAYLPFYLIFGIWGEARLLILIIPLLIFFGLIFLDFLNERLHVSVPVRSKKSNARLKK